MSQGFFDNMNGKQGLVFGLITGIAIVSLVGMGALLANGGSFFTPNNSGNNIADANPTPTPTPTPSPDPVADASKIAAVTKTDHVRGNFNAKLTLVEYSDFQCPFCGRHEPTVEQIMAKYGDKVRLVYRHFPLTSIHPYAQKASEASECASEQGKFWEYHDILFKNQDALTVSDLKKYAGTLSLKQDQFDACLDSGKYTQKVNTEASEAQAAGVTGTPGTFVGDQLVSGAVPFAQFTQIIDSQLSKL
ncbi:MAG: DsbA family protein [Patescibacteria group bacterium]|nr:DsbA family protein [Patescibacteria group bacterium]